MPAELVRVDALLDDRVFFDSFRPFFSPLFGRPSTPIETLHLRPYGGAAIMPRSRWAANV
jgi:hypothetical protein